MALTDSLHVIHRLRTTHITIFYDGVVIIAGLTQLQHIRRHLAPAVWVAAVALSQVHRITDMVRTTIITGQHKIGALILVAHIRECVLQLSDIFHRRTYVRLWLVQLTA